jgi:hypothetical protein
MLWECQSRTYPTFDSEAVLQYDTVVTGRNPYMPRLTALLTIAVLLVSTNTHAASSSNEQVELALRALTLMCLGGGQKVVVTRKGNSEVLVTQAGGQGSESTLDSTTIAGFINGIDNTISGLAADQADKARACMKPYIQLIIRAIIPSTEKITSSETKEPKPPIAPVRDGERPRLRPNPPPHYTYDNEGCLHRTPHGVLLGLPHIQCKKRQ